MFNVPTDSLKMWIIPEKNYVEYDLSTKKLTKLIDKSGNDNNLVNTDANYKPIYVSEENYILFSKAFLETEQEIISSTDNFSIFVVYKNDLKMGRGLDGYSNGWSLSIASDNSGIVKGATAYSVELENPKETKDFLINTVIYENGTGINFSRKGIDFEQTSNKEIPSGSLRYSYKHILLGRYVATGDSYFSDKLQFYELLVYNRKLDDEEIDNIKNYLYFKYMNPKVIKMENNYYSIKESSYNTETKSYNPIDVSLYNNFNELLKDNNVIYNNLFNEITINEETFKPLDKFDKFNFISINSFKTSVIAIKNNKELIFSAQNLSLLSAEKINSFKQTISKVNNGECKTVFSLDNGTTWKTFDNSTSEFINLSNTFPLDNIDSLNIDNLSEENQTKWDSLRDEIYEKGIDSETISTLDFQTLLGDTYKNIRFAYVLYRPSYEDKVALQNMSWNIDHEGDYVVTDEIKLAVNTNRLTATATKEDIEKAKINLLI